MVNGLNPSLMDCRAKSELILFIRGIGMDIKGFTISILWMK